MHVALETIEQELMATTGGGTPYGPSHAAGMNSDRPLSEMEKKLCHALGARIADTTRRLKRP